MLCQKKCVLNVSILYCIMDISNILHNSIMRVHSKYIISCKQIDYQIDLLRNYLRNKKGDWWQMCWLLYILVVSGNLSHFTVL